MSEYIVEVEYDTLHGTFSQKRREEVVRCCDCIYYVRDTNPIDPGWPMMCELTGMDMVSPDCFCAWGEFKR